MHTTRIKSITKVGIEETYDLKVLPYRNLYLSNGILTHNCGKSTLAFQLGRYADPTLDLSRVVFSAEKFRQAIFKAKKGQCVIYDEAFTGLSSRSSLSGINRALVSLMMQMRQKNLFVIIVLPTYFLLDKYVALFRTRALFHVYENSGRRGYYQVYNRKSKKYLYLAGKNTYSYKNKKVRPTLRRLRFYGVFALGDKDIEEKYREMKSKALEETEKDPMTSAQVKYREQRDILIYLMRKRLNLTFMEMSNLVNDYDLEMSFQQIAHICAKFGDKDKETGGKVVKTKKKGLKDDLEPILDDSDTEIDLIDEDL